jgi:site-specific DNA-methyltransferase (adenine-specific)
VKYNILEGDNRDTLKTLEDNSVDAIVTDPPYGIDFLGKDWDANTGALETYRECLRVLKPGGYILAFSAARTYHHLAITLEQAGFEIRDQLMWIYSSGFPKAQDIGKSIQRRQGVEEYKTEKGTNAYPHTTKNQKMVVGSVTADDYKKEKTHPIPTSPEAKQWAGWKTALKPAHEPIAMARKPFKGSNIDNVLTHGVGALNIDTTRIEVEGEDTRSGGANGVSRLTFGEGETSNEDSFKQYTPNEQGRFPSNVIGEVAGYQKYFYCPKVSRKERHIGFDTTQIPTSKGGMLGTDGEWAPEHWHGEKGQKAKTTNSVGNNHPTVKPVELMKYLIKLVTPPNSTVLDPFTGSGSTGMAATELGHTFIGCELDPNYVAIAERRIEAWNSQEQNPQFDSLFYEE